MKEILSILQSDIDDGIIHGGAVLAGKDGSVYCRCEAGYTSPEHKYAMNAETVLDVASTTKVAAAVTALLICHNRGLIDFEAPFTEYLKDFSASLYEPVSVRDLANHVSGFGDVRGQKQRPYFDESGTKMLENMLTTPPQYPPTRHANYSCWNYILLALILERITGEKLTDFCRKEIFDPLEMSSTSLGKPRPEIPLERLGQTMGTSRPGEISDFVAVRIYRDGGCTGNAGLFTSANDYAKLLECYLHRGETPSGKMLFGEAEMREIEPDRKVHFHGYRNFGWSVYEKFLAEEMFGTVLFHSGWSGQTVLFDSSKNMYGIVLTTRCGDYGRAKKNRFEILHQVWEMIK
ncbi:MAG: beta-lactamase family protein [Lentisphaeria bacterium]|nr:beta-lactamase family protein [Lentisphaeria bacterium]